MSIPKATTPKKRRKTTIPRILEEVTNFCHLWKKHQRPPCVLPDQSCRYGCLHNSNTRNWKRPRFRIDSSKWSKIYLNPSVIDKTLILRLDEKGIIRAHWWLKDVRLLQQEMRNPVILPPDHLLVHLLVCHLHDMYGHCGYKNLIYEARRNYQIIESTTCLKVSPIYGSDPIFTSGSRFSTLFRHSHWYVRILAYKA